MAPVHTDETGLEMSAVTSHKLLRDCPNIGGLGAHRFYLQECFGGFKGLAGSEGFRENLVLRP